MTIEEAICALRTYRRQNRVFNASLIFVSKNNYFFRDNCYREFIIKDLINRIIESDEDPIKLVTKMYCDIDWILGESDDDHVETHTFCSVIEYELGKILRMLKDKEKEIMRREQSKV